jgi:hypothetical protein
MVFRVFRQVRVIRAIRELHLEILTDLVFRAVPAREVLLDHTSRNCALSSLTHQKGQMLERSHETVSVLVVGQLRKTLIHTAASARWGSVVHNLRNRFNGFGVAD